MLLRCKERQKVRRGKEIDFNTDAPMKSKNPRSKATECKSVDHQKTKNPIPVHHQQGEDEEKSHKRPQTQREKKPKCSERFDGLNHWPEFDDPNESRKGFRCKFCGMQSDVYCSKCNVHLCFVKEKTKAGQKQRNIRNCFKAFHNLAES